MGDLKGHAIPGSFFLVYGLWLAVNCLRRHLKCRRTGMQYVSTAVYAVDCCQGRVSRLPMEGLVKVVLSTAGMLGELLAHLPVPPMGIGKWWKPVSLNRKLVWLFLRLLSQSYKCFHMQQFSQNCSWYGPLSPRQSPPPPPLEQSPLSNKFFRSRGSNTPGVFFPHPPSPYLPIPIEGGRCGYVTPVWEPLTYRYNQWSCQPTIAGKFFVKIKSGGK